MKSVGESMAIGRCFIEALNKAIRAAEFGYEGLEILKGGAEERLEQILNSAHPLRVFAIYQVLKKEGRESIPELNCKTAYDPWFLNEIAEYADFENSLKSVSLDPATLRTAKRLGMSDKQIAQFTGKKVKEIEEMRETGKIFPSYHFVDTCAGEFEAQTPYFYSTYGEIDEGERIGEKAVLILASGPNRIGQGLEFDTCCTLTSIAYRAHNVKTIIINSNPETVSTDFNVSDRLYIEPLVLESVKDVIRKEKVTDVIVQLGGQTALNMAEALEEWGARIVGTPVKSILAAEDRALFSKLIRKLKLRQPNNRMAASPEEVIRFSKEITYPVLLRPSFVLGGRSMFIAFEEGELKTFLQKRIKVSKDNPVLVDKFLEDAYEYDLDALCDGKNVYIAGIMQHIEAAGIHSGDSACVFPPYKSDSKILEEMTSATTLIALDLGVKGFLNIQFAVKDGILYILEVNPRASRTVPYLSKASGVNLIEAAVRVWQGEDLPAQGLIGRGECRTGWAVKEAVFSFERFQELDPILGPEMKSTGEVIGTGKSFGEAFAKAQASSGTTLPKTGKVFISVHDLDKESVLPIAKELAELGFTISATRGTAEYFHKNGLFPEVILKVHEGSPNIIDHLRSGRISLLINTPLGRFSQKGDQAIRIEAVKRKIPYTTTISAAKAAVEGIRYLKKEEIEVRPL
jgi:carbamoyl-phosphate synthase large subunit